MRRMEAVAVFLAGIAVFAVILSGCGLLSKPAPKMETSETASRVLRSSPFLERFSSAPHEFYDIDESAAALFSAMTAQDWKSAAQALAALQNAWGKVRPSATEKAAAEGGASLDKLAGAVAAQKTSEACRSLNKFMGNASKIGENYQLSPIADMITIGIAVREAGFYAGDENWGKAAAKSKELENVWNQSKSSMEQMGVLGELTKAHFLINQMKDAIDAENKDSFLEHLEEVNETLGGIRKFYYGK